MQSGVTASEQVDRSPGLIDVSNGRSLRRGAGDSETLFATSGLDLVLADAIEPNLSLVGSQARRML
jgi:hypothetical protein